MSKPSRDLTVSIPPNLLRELLTDSELRMVKQRLKIVELLKQGQTVRAISQEVGVGTDTVVRVARKIDNSPALQLAFQKQGGGSSKSKWVFGQIGSEKEV